MRRATTLGLRRAVPPASRDTSGWPGSADTPLDMKKAAVGPHHHRERLQPCRKLGEKAMLVVPRTRTAAPRRPVRCPFKVEYGPVSLLDHPPHPPACPAARTTLPQLYGADPPNTNFRHFGPFNEYDAAGNCHPYGRIYVGPGL
jgi:hypothetical protein